MLATVAVVATVAGCSSSEEQPAASPVVSVVSPYVSEVRSQDIPVRGGRIAFGLPIETNSWNPGLAQWGAYSLTVARTMFDFLAAFDDKGGVHPYLAQTMTPNADFTAWTVTMRSGVKFHDGKPLTAQLVVEQQQYLMTSPVVGGAFALVDRYEVKSDLQFVAHMNRPFAMYPTAMTSQLGAMADPEWLRKNDGEHPVGTGPFRLDSWNVGHELVVKRNADYWRTDERGQQMPYLDQIDFKVITDDGARISALRNGDLDIQLQTYATPELVALIDEARTGSNFQVFSDEKLETPEDTVVFNTRAGRLFADRDARLALAYATDRQDYVDQVTAGLTQVADGPFSPGSRWWSDVPYPTYDPVKAKALIDGVKARNGGTFSFTLLGAQSPEAQKALQYFQTQWAKFGIDVKVQSVETRAKIISLVTGEYDASLLQLFDAPNPASDVVFFAELANPERAATVDWSLNFSGFNDAENTTAALAAEGTLDPEAQATYFATVSRRLASEMPYLWLDHAPRTLVASLRLVNVVHNTLPDGATGIDFFQGSPMLQQVWVRDTPGTPG